MLSGRAYSIAAGTDGAVTTDALSGVTRALVPVELTIDPLFGVIVELVECGDTGSRVNPSFDHGFGWRLDDPGLEAVSWNHNRPHLSLSGIDELFTAAFSDHDRRLILFKGLTKLSGSTSLRVHADVWSYEKADFEVPIEDLRETGRISTETRCLTPSVGGWGTLHLSFTGPLIAEGPSGCFEYKPAGHLCVASADDASRKRRIPVRAPLERGLDVPGVPAGAHEVWLEMGAFKRKFPTDGTPIPVLVKAGSTHDLSFNVAGVGTLVVEVRAPDGDVYSGDIALRLKRLDRVGTYWKRFKCAPYRFPGLEPGDYQIELERVAIFSGRESRQALGTVVADTASQALIQL